MKHGNKGEAEIKSFKTFKFDVYDSMFYDWECVSLFRPNHSTFDIVIKEPTDLMCLLHILYFKR